MILRQSRSASISCIDFLGKVLNGTATTMISMLQGILKRKDAEPNLTPLTPNGLHQTTSSKNLGKIKEVHDTTLFRTYSFAEPTPLNKNGFPAKNDSSKIIKIFVENTTSKTNKK